MTGCTQTGEPAERQMAICYLLLKGEHWIPLAPDRKLSADDRSSPHGPAITAEVIAEIEGDRIIGWGKVGALFQEVGSDGEVAPPDTRLAASIIGALMTDGAASTHGAVGINSRIVEGKRAREQRRLPKHLMASAIARAETQILDKLHGFSAVGVRFVQAPIGKKAKP